MSNKTSDKNVGIIEELIQEYKTYNDLDGIQDLSIYVNALENILADYTRQKQTNEEHQKINGELRERVKELEKYTIHLTDEEYRNVTESAQRDVANDSVIAHKFAVMQQQIDEKDKRIKVLEAKKKYLESLSEYQHNCLIDSIPKHEVKDEIDVHTNLIKIKTGNPTLDEHFRDRENYVLDVLQKILRKGEK